MRDLVHKRNRFVSIADNYSQIYCYNNSKEQLSYSAGVLNTLWNSWNNFWKDFWLAHITGGFDFSKEPITPIFPSYNDKQACHYLLFACGKKGRHNNGDSINYVHQEATWGDPAVITKIATHLISHHSYMNYVLGVLSHYQVSISHVQRIRNSFIHMNNENIYNLNTIAPYYTFSGNQKLIDILESNDISSNTRCFDNLINNLKGMLVNL